MIATSEGLVVEAAERHDMTGTRENRRLWLVIILVAATVLGLLLAGGIAWFVHSLPAPADILKVVSAKWLNGSPPRVQLVVRARRADGRPIEQGGVTIGVAQGE